MYTHARIKKSYYEAYSKSKGRSVMKIYLLEKAFIDSFSFLEIYFTYPNDPRSLESTFHNIVLPFLTLLHRSFPHGN